MSGLEGVASGFPYVFSTNISGSVSGGQCALDNTNPAAATNFSIHKLSARNNDMSNWIESWDDSSNAVKGMLNISSRVDSTKFALYKLTGTPTGYFGDGADGDVTISGGDTININTDAITPGRTYADGVYYSVTSLGSNAISTDSVPGGIEAGDEIMLINLQSNSTSNYANVGNWELLVVSNVNSTTITTTTNIQNNYGDDGGNTNVSSHDVIIQRVPNYSSVTIENSGKLTCNAWTGSIGGLVAFKCSGTCTINGAIDVDGKGYRGGYVNYSGQWYYYSGEGFVRGPSTTTSENYGGGARGVTNAAGGGGGYGTAGDTGDGRSEGSLIAGVTSGGRAYGEATLGTKLMLGGGGGASSDTSARDFAPNGGGIVLVYASTLDIYGSVTSKGIIPTNSMNDVVGGGAGGAILLKSSVFKPNASTINADGAAGRRTAQPTPDAYSGDGGDGVIGIYYSNITGSQNASPAPYEDDEFNPDSGDSFDFLINWLSRNGLFDSGESVLVTYTFNY